MKEVIAKSKYHKLERQLAKQKVEEEIEQLDDKETVEELFGVLRETGSFRIKGDRIEGISEDGETKETPDADYEKNVRELAYDRRGQASDRTKTEDEIAKDKAEKLKELEKKRLARMAGEIDEEENETKERDSDHDDVDDDDFNDADEFGFKTALDYNKKHQDKNEGESSNSDDEENDEESLNGNLSIDEEFQALDSDDDEGVELSEEDDSSLKKKGSSKKPNGDKSDPVALTFDMPEDVADLLDIFAQYPASKQPTIVERILTLYHPSLRPENKEKLADFTNILAEYVILSADIDPQSPDEDVSSIIDELIRTLKGLAEKYTESLAEFFREQLNKAEARVQAAISKNRNDIVTSNPSHFFLFTLIAIIFSTPDHFNQIVTPASLLLGFQLSQIRLNSASDILAGLYSASTALTYQRIAKRFIPEITVFLSRALYLLSPKQVKIEDLPHDIFLGVMNPKKRLASLDNLSPEAIKSEYNEPLALRLLHTIEDTPKNQRKKLYTRLYLKTLQVFESYMTLWTDNSAFIEIFSPFVPLVADHPPTLEKLTKRLKFSQNSRVPLTLQSHKPIPLASKIPKFEENYSVDKKSYDPDVTRREHKKLLAVVKKERKSTLRELRRDNEFLAREKLRERKQQDKEYHEKLDRLIRTVATEEGTEKNKYDREKRARKKKN